MTFLKCSRISYSDGLLNQKKKNHNFEDLFITFKC